MKRTSTTTKNKTITTTSRNNQRSKAAQSPLAQFWTNDQIDKVAEEETVLFSETDTTTETMEAKIERVAKRKK
jgi:hypothetical protein